MGIYKALIRFVGFTGGISIYLAAKAVTVEWAARIHRVPLAEFLDILHQATKNNTQS